MLQRVIPFLIHKPKFSWIFMTEYDEFSKFTLAKFIRVYTRWMKPMSKFRGEEFAFRVITRCIAIICAKWETKWDSVRLLAKEPAVKRVKSNFSMVSVRTHARTNDSGGVAQNVTSISLKDWKLPPSWFSISSERDISGGLERRAN